MKKNHWLLRLGGLLLVSYTLLTLSVIAAGTAGTQNDPLVTLSYLNNTFMSQLLGEVNTKLESHDAELSRKLDEQVQADTKALVDKYGLSVDEGNSSGNVNTFTVVTLSDGQTLYGEVGCEVMLRVGTAVCVSSSTPGLIDETDGTTLGGNGALAQNHLYMMTVSERGVKSTAATTKVLVRGGYSVR